MEKLVAEENVAVKWIAFPLHPETPPQGQSLEELFAGRGKDIPAMLERLKAVAAEEGLPWGMRTMTFNSRRAQELGKWAEEQGKGEAFHSAMFHAYFAEGQNIYDPAVLTRQAGKVGLEPDEALEAVESGRYAQAVDDDWSYSRQRGISAVPSFLAGRRLLVGAQPYNQLKNLIDAARTGGGLL
ncbi:MAG: DsbA family protein [Deltaproteobacteria bacterium]|nr:DsbA family protein [Deltaproteobacteria bacterium]